MFSKLWRVEWNSHFLILPRICFKLFSFSKVYHIRKSQEKLSLSNIAQNFFWKVYQIMKSPNPTHWGLSFSILATLDDVFSDYIVTKVLIGLVTLDQKCWPRWAFISFSSIEYLWDLFLQNQHEMSKLLMQIISVIEHWPPILIISVPG